MRSTSISDVCVRRCYHRSSAQPRGSTSNHSQMGVEAASHYLLPAVALGEDGMSHLSATVRTGWAYSRSLTGRSYADVHKLLVDSGMWTISTTFSQAPYAEDPGMATDPRQAIAPPWENARLKVAVATALKTDQSPASQHLKDEEVTVADDTARAASSTPEQTAPSTFRRPAFT